MKVISNIIFVSEQNKKEQAALEQAVELAHSNQAKLTVISCFEDMRHFILMQPGGDSLLQETLEHEKSELDHFLRLMLGKKNNINTKIFLDKPVQDIIREVTDSKTDLLIKPVEKTNSLRNVIFGSVDTNLMRLCPCPVWLIKSTEQKGYKEVLVALDYEPDSPDNDLLNLRLLDMATSLALSEFSELHVVHAWRLENESFLRSPRLRNSDEEVDKMVEEEYEIRRVWFSNIVNLSMSKRSKDTVRYLSPRLHLEKGYAVDVIPLLADRLEVELLVIGTIGRKGIPGYFIGNTAESVLANIDCSVLAIKLGGFISPLTV